MSTSPTPGTSPVFAAAIAKVRVRFVATLDQNSETLARLTPRLNDPETAAAAMTRASEIAHKIRGVARTLGFEELGLRAGETEDLTTPPFKMPWTDADTEQVQDSLRALRRCIDEARRGGS